jgi:hypothetical protein
MKRNLNFFTFLPAGFVLATILIFFSEFSGFSHTNFIPFGGKSWALWAYPAVSFLGFLISSFLFKIKNTPKILLLVAAVIFILFFLVFGGNLFVNPIPFGK